MALDLAPFRFHGWLGNRKTQSFGWRYDFDDASFTPTEPIPDWLRAAARQGGRASRDCSRTTFAHALVARYDPGAGIGWHKDRDVFEQVVGISLNTPATLRFRQRTGDRLPPRQPRRSSRARPICCRGEARCEWEHSIAPGEQLRFSITFRTLSDKGRRKAAAQRSSKPARHSATQRAAVKRAEVGRVERRVPFGQVDHPHPRIGRELAHRREEIVDRHPARPRARRRRELRAVDHVDVAVDHQRVAMRDMVERPVDRMLDPVAPDVADGDDEVAGVDRILVHRLGCWRSSRARPGRCSRPAARPRSARAPDCRC